MGRGRPFRFGALASADSLPPSGVVPGTYSGLTVNASGLVTHAAAGGAARWVDTDISTATMAATPSGNLDVPVIGLRSNDVILGVTYDVRDTDLQYSTGGGFGYVTVSLFDPPAFPLGGAFVAQQYAYPGPGAKFAAGSFGQVSSYGLAATLKGGWQNPTIRLYGYDSAYSNIVWSNINNNGAKLRVRLLAMGV